MAVLARCSKCDESFSLETPRASYLIRDLAPNVGQIQSPQPDPLLAEGMPTSEQIDRPAIDSIAPVEAAMPIPEPEIAPQPSDFPDEPSEGDEDDGFFSDGMDDDEALFGMDESAEATASDADVEVDEAAAERPRTPAHPVREALGVFLLSGLGGAAGFQGSLQFGFEPLNAIGVGLGAGLTFGWAWIRWAERKR